MAYEVMVRGLNRSNLFRVGYGASVRKVNATTPVYLDLDSGNARKQLQNERSRFLVLPEFVIPLQRAGNLATGTTATGLVYRFPRAARLTAVTAAVGTAPATSSIILDVHKVAAGDAATAAGTTIFTTQSRRPTIAAGATVSTLDATNGVPQVTEFAAGDLVRVEIDQVGTGTVGADLVVQLIGY